MMLLMMPLLSSLFSRLLRCRHAATYFDFFRADAALYFRFSFYADAAAAIFFRCCADAMIRFRRCDITPLMIATPLPYFSRSIDMAPC